VDEVIDRLDLGPWLDRDVATIPYGVRKLLDLGRALVTRPRLLLCDEPMSGLDDAARDATVVILAELARSGIRLLVIEHDLRRLATIADHLVVLDFGQVIAAGAPSSVLAEPAVQAAYGGSLQMT
jgi:branched-chain amino acid transport system ATP-binding protein